MSRVVVVVDSSLCAHLLPGAREASANLQSVTPKTVAASRDWSSGFSQQLSPCGVRSVLAVLAEGLIPLLFQNDGGAVPSTGSVISVVCFSPPALHAVGREGGEDDESTTWNTLRVVPTTSDCSVAARNLALAATTATVSPLTTRRRSGGSLWAIVEAGARVGLSEISGESEGDIIVIAPASPSGHAPEACTCTGLAETDSRQTRSGFEPEFLSCWPDGYRLHVVDTSPAANVEFSQLLQSDKPEGTYRRISLPPRSASPTSADKAVRFSRALSASFAALGAEVFAPWRGVLRCGRFEVEVSLNPSPRMSSSGSMDEGIPPHFSVVGMISQPNLGLAPSRSRHFMLPAGKSGNEGGLSVDDLRRQSRALHFLHTFANSLHDRRVAALIRMTASGGDDLAQELAVFGIVSAIQTTSGNTLALCLDVMCREAEPPDFNEATGVPWLGSFSQLSPSDVRSRPSPSLVNSQSSPGLTTPASSASSLAAVAANPASFWKLEDGSVSRGDQHAVQAAGNEFALPGVAEDALASRASSIICLLRLLPEANACRELWRQVDDWRALAHFYDAPQLLGGLAEVLQTELDRTTQAVPSNSPELLGRNAMITELTHAIHDHLEGADLSAQLSYVDLRSPEVVSQ